MRIRVNLFATLACFKPDNAGKGPWDMECEARTTVADLLGILNIPSSKAKIIFVNNVHARKDTVLKEGDQVGIFPPVGGG